MIKFAQRAYRFSTCYYKLLNVSTDASMESIKKQYFELAKKYHPDMNPDTTVDPEKFRQIQQAYKILSDETTRQKYDRENGIINKTYYGDADFGDQESVYAKYSKMNDQRIYEEKQKEYDDYFNKQYFDNPDYFKRKVESGDRWNMSEKLYRQHQKIQENKEDYVIHRAFKNQVYYEKKADLEYIKIKPEQSFAELIYEFRTLFILIGIVGVSYFSIKTYQDLNKNKKKIVENKKLNEGGGYKLKITPLNVS